MGKKENNVTVFRKSGEVLTTSLDIAEKFKRPHDSVLKSIRNLDCSDKFSLVNYYESNYTKRGKTYPCYNITRDGFSFLVMGFNGKDAAAWKERYITAFNKLEEAVRRHKEPNHIEAREKVKYIRRGQTDAIQSFVEYAELNGSKSADKYYMNFTKMQNAILFIINKSKSDNVRDLLNTEQLFQIGTADQLIAQTIREGIKQEMYYKDIYKVAKRKVKMLADLIGVSEVPSCGSLLGHNSKNALEEEDVAASPSKLESCQTKPSGD